MGHHAFPLLLVVALLVALRLPFGRRRPRPPDLRVELAWALGAGLAFAGIATWSLAPVMLDGEVSAPDFFEYCAGVLWINGHDVQLFPARRSVAAGLLPALLARRLGVLDGLAAASVGSAVVLGLGLYLWGRLVAGRAAGLMAVALGLAAAPLVSATRMLSYYPEMTAGLVLGAAATAWALTRPSRAALLACGAGIGLVLLLDVRGLVWALAWLGGALLTLLIGRAPWQRRASWALLLLLPIAASHAAGRLAYPPYAASLEKQVDLRPHFSKHAARDAEPAVITYETAFVWGRSDLAELPGTVRFLWEQREPSRKVSQVQPPEDGHVQSHLVPWQAAALLGGLLALAALGRRPQSLLALAVTSAPFLVFLWAAGSMGLYSPRFYLQALPAVAVLLASGVGGLLSLLPGPWRGPDPWVRALVLVVILLLSVLGWIPGWLSPHAAWRAPLPVVTRDLDALPELAEQPPDHLGRPQLACLLALQADEVAHGPPFALYRLCGSGPP